MNRRFSACRTTHLAVPQGSRLRSAKGRVGPRAVLVVWVSLGQQGSQDRKQKLRKKQNKKYSTVQ